MKNILIGFFLFLLVFFPYFRVSAESLRDDACLVVYDALDRYQLPLTFHVDGFSEQSVENKIRIVFGLLQNVRPQERISAPGIPKTARILDIVNKGDGYYIINFNEDINGEPWYSSNLYSYFDCLINSFSQIEGVKYFSIYQNGKFDGMVGGLTIKKTYQHSGILNKTGFVRYSSSKYKKRSAINLFNILIHNKCKYILPQYCEVYVYDDDKLTISGLLNNLKVKKINEYDKEITADLFPSSLEAENIKLFKDAVVVNLPSASGYDSDLLFDPCFIDSVVFTMAELKSVIGKYNTIAFYINGEFKNKYTFNFSKVHGNNMPDGINYFPQETRR